MRFDWFDVNSCWKESKKTVHQSEEIQYSPTIGWTGMNETAVVQSFVRKILKEGFQLKRARHWNWIYGTFGKKTVNRDTITVEISFFVTAQFWQVNFWGKVKSIWLMQMEASANSLNFCITWDYKHDVQEGTFANVLLSITSELSRSKCAYTSSSFRVSLRL